MAFIGVVAARDEQILFIGDLEIGSEVSYTLAVEEILKGDPDEFTVILTGLGGGDCGLPMAVGERWRIDAYWSEGKLRANICSSSQLMGVGVPTPPVPLRVAPEGLAAAGIALGIAAAVLIRRRRHRSQSVA